MILSIEKYIVKEVRENVAPRLLYDIKWEALSPSGHLPFRPFTSNGHDNSLVLAFLDNSGICQLYMDRLLSHTSSLHHALITRGSNFSASSPSSSALCISIRPEVAEDYHYALRSIFQHFIPDVKEKAGTERQLKVRILFGWPLDTLQVCDKAELGQNVLASQVFDSCGTMLYLIQALVAEAQYHHVEICVLTAGAAVGIPISISSEKLESTECIAACAQASVHGLGAVVASEFPEMHLTLIDLDPCLNLTAQIEDLAKTILFSPDIHEDRLAIRDGSLFAPRTIRRKMEGGIKRETINDNRCAALITGGFGGIGKEVCKWLLQTNANVRAIFLAGRHLPEDPTSWLESLLPLPTLDEEPKKQGRNQEFLFLFRGVYVSFVQADVANEDDVKRLFDTMETMKVMIGVKEQISLPPIRLIYHCAGVLRDRTVINLEWDLFLEVLAPKAQGAWNIVRQCLARKVELDDLVLFSSITNIFGTPGQVESPPPPSPNCFFLRPILINISFSLP